MLGLGNYESSSEDEVEYKATSALKQEVGASQVGAPPIEDGKTQHTLDVHPAVQETGPDKALSGPVLGPIHDIAHSPASGGSLSTPRTRIHEITLPPVPNLDIPPSPPGSPDLPANARFAHFLSLKKQGIHFNDKLANSTSLKNPNLLQKMMEHVGIHGHVQHSSSLSPHLWDVSNLPSWGYKEELARTQRELSAIAEESRRKGHRNTVEFVPDSSQPKFATQSNPRQWK